MEEKAIRFDKYFPPFVLSLLDIERPTLRSGEVLVEISIGDQPKRRGERCWGVPGRAPARARSGFRGRRRRGRRRRVERQGSLGKRGRIGSEERWESCPIRSNP